MGEPVTFDSDELPAEEAVELKRRVEEPCLFDLPAQAGDLPRGAADHRRYTVTVEEGGRSHTVQLADPSTRRRRLCAEQRGHVANEDKTTLGR